MGKSFQFNNRKETEKTEDVINTLVSATAPLVSTYDDANNTLTLSVNTGKDATELLKVGSEITSGQLLKMNNEEVIGITIGKLQSNILQNGADLTSGHILKISGSQVVGEATGVSQDNILVSGGSIANDEYLYNDDGVIKGRTIDASVVSLLKAGDVVIDSVLKSDGNENLVLKRNTTPKITIGNNETTFNGDVLIDNGGTDAHLNICGKLAIYGDNDSDKDAAIPLFVGRNDTGNIVSGYWQGLHHNQGGIVSGGSNDWNNHISFYCDGVIMNTHWVISATNQITSDDRLKSEEVDLANGLDIILKLKPKTYFKHLTHMVDSDDERPVDKDASGNIIDKFKEIGLIAQDVLKIPELAHCVIETPIIKNRRSVYTLNYEQLIPVLCKSIQELNARIITLENKNNVD